MPIDYETLKNWKFPALAQRYTTKDTILYALGVGAGQDPTAPEHLRFTYEADLHALPTLATVLAVPGFWMRDPATGIDWKRLLHGEQRAEFHTPIPPEGEVRAEMRVIAVCDKGADKGAVVVSERRLFSESGDLLATLQQSTFCRADGGFSARGQPSDDAPPPLPSTPHRGPDLTVELATRPESALLYRLCADPNPLHADPEIARAAGFERPILHGLATYGLAGRAVIAACCGHHVARLRTLSARFASPVFPGETVSFEMWCEAGEVHFRGRVEERGATVLSHGLALIAP